MKLKLCAAILFSGCNALVSLRMLASIGIPVVTPRYSSLHNVSTSGQQMTQYVATLRKITNYLFKIKLLFDSLFFFSSAQPSKINCSRSRSKIKPRLSSLLGMTERIPLATVPSMERARFWMLQETRYFILKLCRFVSTEALFFNSNNIYCSPHSAPLG